MTDRKPAIEFINLAAQRERLGDRIEQAIAGVIEHGRFINGPEVGRFEGALAQRCGVAHVVGCGSGTDALILALIACAVGPGDAVFVPAFTFAAPAEAAALLGATPVFVDVDDRTFTMDATSLAGAVQHAASLGLEPKVVVPVDLFGNPADYDAIGEAAEANGLMILADAAQSLGGSFRGEPVGSLTAITATSFFPAKPLGCYGDGGAVMTDDSDLAATVRSLRSHGTGRHKYDHVRVGMNARLDTLQAAILLEKLVIFSEELDARDKVADRYRQGFGDALITQTVDPDSKSSWAQFTIVTEHRDAVAAHLEAVEIPTAIHYPLPLHLQPAYQGFPRAPEGLPSAEFLASRVLSLPFHPYLDEGTQDLIIQEVLASLPTR